jgi:hypothetical protein
MQTKTSKQIAKYHGKTIAHGKGSAVATSASDGRAFHVGDYRRSAAMIKGMRRDNHGHLKNAEQQGRVDMLAAAMAAVFEADSHEFGVPFSPGYFVAGTK